jgi:DNA invertase Pin-like site-specific DNA recombinase
VRAFAVAQGWTLVAEFSDVASGKDDRRPGYHAALTRCRQPGAVLAAARLNRITRRAHTLSQLLEDGYSIRAADMPGADDLMMRVYAAMAQKERELISERTKAALAAAKARGARLGGDRGHSPMAGPDSGAAVVRARRGSAERATHRPLLEVERLREIGINSRQALARGLTEGGIPTPGGGETWTHTTAGRLLARTDKITVQAAERFPLACVRANDQIRRVKREFSIQARHGRASRYTDGGTSKILRKAVAHSLPVGVSTLLIGAGSV